MRKANGYIQAAVFAVLTIVLIMLVRLVDVRPFGPRSTNIGLSHINQVLSVTTGLKPFWYGISEMLGAFALILAAAVTVACFVQVIKRRSITNTDKELRASVCMYLAVMTIYAFFETVIINYRPVIMPGDMYPEASFPSSHTMLTCVVMIGAMAIIEKYTKNKTASRLAGTVCAVIACITVASRALSGAHWATDIIGGLLVGAGLLALFRNFTYHDKPI